MALNMPSFLFSSSLFLSRRHSNFRPAAHLQLKQPHRFRARSTTRAVVNVEEEADWIIVDVSLLGLGADAQSQATDLEYDGRELVRKARKNEPAELSVVLCSDEEIKKLNTQWRDKDRPTDVLSFPQNDQAVRLYTTRPSFIPLLYQAHLLPVDFENIHRFSVI